ncbi:MAG: alpha-galactosidase [Chloroflexota bacterium]|nr:alpha-galactosidase [Chloroflexota bacterium]
MAISVTFIGAGSLGFTRRLIRDMLCVSELADSRFVLHDIDPEALDRVSRLCRREIELSDLPATIETELDRPTALEGADYVINCARIGGLEAFASDIEIPLRYGVDQCVGDTICAGGIMYGQRSIPKMLEFCHDVVACAKPGALLLNYANPMAMNTWAALDYSDADVVGLCHGVQGGHRLIAKALGAESVSEVEIVAAGINHQTWYLSIVHRGREVEADELLAAMRADPEIARREPVRLDVLERFGYFSTESNGHLSEYLPWYRKRGDEIEGWIDRERWIDGRTGGYLEYCRERNRTFAADYERQLAAASPIEESERSDEHGSHIIEAIETGRPYRGHFNVRNDGAIPNLPPDCVVEVPGYVDRHGINVGQLNDLPLACAATCQASIDVQRMAKEAAVSGDRELLRLAMLHDPLVGAVCSPGEIWSMTEELLTAQAPWLPQYESAA